MINYGMSFSLVIQKNNGTSPFLMGKSPKNNGTSQLFMDKSTISTGP
jgi:hypothetical protein